MASSSCACAIMLQLRTQNAPKFKKIFMYSSRNKSFFTLESNYENIISQI